MIDQPELFPARRARGTDPATSFAATQGPDICPHIMRAFSILPPMTDDELCAVLTQFPPPSVKTARSRLYKAGLLMPAGYTRPSNLGRQMMVWQLQFRPTENVVETL